MRLRLDKNLLIGILAVIILMAAFVFFAKPKLPPGDLSQVTLEMTKDVTRYFKSASFVLVALVGALLGWLCYMTAESRSVKSQSKVYKPCRTAWLLGIIILLAVIWVFYYLAQRNGWWNLHLIENGLSKPEWISSLTRVSSLSAAFGLGPIWLAHSVDCLIVFSAAYLLAFAVTKLFRR